MKTFRLRGNIISFENPKNIFDIQKEKKKNINECVKNALFYINEAYDNIEYRYSAKEHLQNASKQLKKIKKIF